MGPRLRAARAARGGRAHSGLITVTASRKALLPDWTPPQRRGFCLCDIRIGQAISPLAPDFAGAEKRDSERRRCEGACLTNAAAGTAPCPRNRISLRPGLSLRLWPRRSPG